MNDCLDDRCRRDGIELRDVAVDDHEIGAITGAHPSRRFVQVVDECGVRRGADGGHTVDFRGLAETGITLVGRAESFDGSTMRFGNDLRSNIEGGDANYLSLLDEADAYVERNGLHLPEEPKARDLGPDPEAVRNPIRELDLARNGVESIIWATGFAADYGWLEIDAFDGGGRPLHQRGVSSEPGIYFLGLPWQSRRGSSFIWGVWHDAKFLADHIAIQRGYFEHDARLQRSIR